MSYTFGNTGGTTWGLKTYNQIFALNSQTVGAAEYWDQSYVNDLDTVICSTNHRMLTYLNGKWWGNGIIGAVNKNGSDIEPGDYVIVSSSASGSTRPSCEITTSASELDHCFGVVLQGGADGTLCTLGTQGSWPCKTNGTIIESRPMRLDSSPAGTLFDASSISGDGFVGKYINVVFPIITSTAATPTTAQGHLVSLYGTANQIYA